MPDAKSIIVHSGVFAACALYCLNSFFGCSRDVYFDGLFEHAFPLARVRTELREGVPEQVV